MDKQHERIKGYRKLTDDEIALMNEGKQLAEQCGHFVEKLQAMQATDKRCVNLGLTNLQQGFMWTIRAIARPESF